MAIRSPFALVLLVVLAGTVVAQPATDGEPSVAESRSALEAWTLLKEDYEARIAAEQSRNGALSPALVELLVALGLAHQEYGRNDLAVEVLGRALHVRRANDGLYSFEQVPLLRQLMMNEAALGRVEEAAEFEGRVLELARRNSGDLRSVPIFREAGDRQLALYERRLAGDVPGMFEVNVAPTVFGPGRRGVPPGGIEVSRARGNYTAAIRSILRNGGVEHEDLLPIEQSLTRSYYLQAMDRDRASEGMSGLAYGGGRQSYRRRVAYSIMTSGEAIDVAKALVELADWDLLFSHNGLAVDIYDEAYALLRNENVPEPEIRALFPLENAIRLPIFEESPLALPESSARGVGHVDLEFEVSRYGVARAIDVVGMSSASLHGVRRDVARAIASSRFRPRPPSDGNAPFRVRYYIE